MCYRQPMIIQRDSLNCAFFFVVGDVPLILERLSPHASDNTEAWKLHFCEETSIFTGFTSYPVACLCFSKALRMLASSYSLDQMGLKDLIRLRI